MTVRWHALIAALAIDIVASGSRADAQTTATLPLVHVEHAPSLDGTDGWETAEHARIAWDFTHGRAASEPTDVALEADTTSLYVRFTVPQKEPLTATQAVNDVGAGTDDDVTIRLWPSGPNGFVYSFTATPRGTHYEGSSENSNFAPTWTSIGRPTVGGYVVTMQIPLRVLRGNGHAWLVQFERDLSIASERDVWSHAPGQIASDQVAYAGALTGTTTTSAARPSPRAGVYALGQAGAPSAGGWTSRMGADVAVPVTATTSVVATIHPDFSNVELDQETIAPTTFLRSYQEVRPFFTQGAKFYDAESCYACPAGSTLQELYTPAIPTPRRGYQLEGTEGRFSIGALDAVGFGRLDTAQTLTWSDPNNVLAASATRVSSDTPDVHDVVNFASLQYTGLYGIEAYAEGGTDHRTSAGGFATDDHRLDVGVAYSTKDDFDAFALRSLGPQWDPVDGFTPVNDIGGYGAIVRRTMHFDGPLQSIALLVLNDRYASTDGFGTNVYDAQQSATFSFANRVHATVFTGSSFYRVDGDPKLHPANQQGFRIDYRFQTPLQSTYYDTFGPFGTGWLTSIDRLLALRVAQRFTTTFEAYSTSWFGPSGTDRQWLDRASAAFDIDPRTTFLFGVRKLIGTAPPFPGQGLPIALNQTNVTFSLARHRPNDDIYVVYGDASLPSTLPALIVKYVHYFGAQKGT